MSGYVGKFLTAVTAALEFNSATLSGAIDIIVIEDDKGNRHCSPFYVRFGKLHLLKSRGIPVDIVLNDKKTDLRMYLGAAGEAYFYDPSLADKLQTTSGENPFSRTNVDGEMVEHEVETADGHCSEDPAEEGGAVTSSSSPMSPTTTSDPDCVNDEQDTKIPAESSGVASPFSSPTTPKAAPNNDVQFHTRAIRSTSDLGFQNFGYLSDSEMELTRAERDGTAEVVDEPRSPPVGDSQRRWNSQWARSRSVLRRQCSASSSSRPSKRLDGQMIRRKSAPLTSVQFVTDLPIPDSSVDDGIAHVPSEDQLSSLFGLPESDRAATNEELFEKSQSMEGIAGAAQTEDCKVGGQEDVSERKLIDSRSRSFDIIGGTGLISPSSADAEVERDEENKLELRSIDGFEEDEGLVGLGIGEQLAKALSKDAKSSLAQNNVSWDEQRIEMQDETDVEGVIEMSLCGKAIRNGMGEADMMAVFNEHRLNRAQFEADPNILYDEELMFRIEDRLVTLKVAVPFVMAMLAYKTPMDIDNLSRMVIKSIEEKPSKAATSPTPSRRFTWFGWSSPPVTGEPLLAEDDLEDPTVDGLANFAGIEQSMEEQPREAQIAQIDIDVLNEMQTSVSSKSPDFEDENVLSTELEISTTVTLTAVQDGDGDSAAMVVIEEEFATQTSEEAIFVEADYDSECFSFLPSSEQLAELDLKSGANEIRFVISSRNASELRCRVFLWRNDSKIVISDVDGTITRSDVLGHLLPAVGRDWSQVGVAGLYSLIAKNGYKMLYLTARPIGQASQTRDFLHNVAQGSARLPNGPVLMSPNRLMESFTREVIRRKPHEFKIACLRDIRTLFPPTYNPFHAGFGNRDTDVISYRAVGLIPQRIFVVNPRGELVVMNATYESTASYSSLQVLVENVFPDITGKTGQEWVRHATETATYNDWNYWRATPPDIDLDALLSGPASSGT